MGIEAFLDQCDADFVSGYRDGHDRDAPEPSANRSACYRHSFAVGRAEREYRDAGPAVILRLRAQNARMEDLKKAGVIDD